MKAKVSRGGGFRGALNYIFDVGEDATHTKKAERVGGNMAGNDPRELSLEFSAVRKLRPDISKPVWHCSLSLPPGERLSAEKWEAVAADFMQRMGFDQSNTPWVAVRHQDTDKDHIHIVASRVGLDGKVWLGQWEARRAIEATQELERAHGLTLTPGLGDARAERRKLTSNEINMAVRTGSEPPRQKLQRLLDEAMEGGPSVLEFAERLQAAGVGVRANLASTGRMNGFSFELDGVPFKGSDLGKRYTWAGLQRAGIRYEQARDLAGLERFRFRPAVADREERPGIAAGRELPARGLRAAAGRSRDRDGAGIGAAGPAPAGRDPGVEDLRRGDGHSAPDAGRADGAYERERSAGVRGEGQDAGRDHLRPVAQPGTAGNEPQQHGADRAAGGDLARQAGERAAGHDESRRPTDRGSERDAPAPLAAGAGPDSGRGRGRDVGGDWAKHFRQASAAKRRAADSGLGQKPLDQGHAKRARVAESDRQSARELDPTAYLEASGYTVKREGRHLSVMARGDEIYRVTQRHDGRWLWCDRYGNEGGDNIDLVREIEPGTGYAEAVYRLLGAPTVRQQPRPSEPKRQPPQLPAQGLVAREYGRDYLKGRGISPDTIEYAEKAGMVRYADGAVLFVGYDSSGTAQNVTRRAIAPVDPVQKRDLRGSDKSYPPILPGDPAKVWIVEGGVDALALRDIAVRSGQQPPTIIVSGGASVRSFLERGDVQAILNRAERVTVAVENEKSPEAQAKADAWHRKQAQRVAEITGREVCIWMPKPEHGKDLADMNARQVAEIERKRQAEIAAMRKSRGYDGPSLG